MPRYVSINKNTGELEKGCVHCCFYTYGEPQDVENFPLAPEHELYEITAEEKEELEQIEYVVKRGGKDFFAKNLTELTQEELYVSNFNYVNKVDVQKAKLKFVDRDMDENNNPIKLVIKK